MRPRDTQRSKLYAAESVVRSAIGDTAMKDRLAMLVFIEKIERDKWFIKNYGHRKFIVHDGRGRTSAGAWGSRTITLPRWSRTPLIILHEIAHWCNPDGAGHGWEYAAVYLKLVRHFLGAEIHEKLKASFKTHRVRYKKPRIGKPMSEERKAELRARLVMMRERKAAAKPSGGVPS